MNRSSVRRTASAPYQSGRQKALDSMGLVHKQDDNSVISSFIDSLPEYKGSRRSQPASAVRFNRMGSFGPKVDLSNSSLPANV